MTINQPNTRSNPNSNPTTKQPTIVCIELNIVVCLPTSQWTVQTCYNVWTPSDPGHVNSALLDSISHSSLNLPHHLHWRLNIQLIFIHTWNKSFSSKHQQPYTIECRQITTQWQMHKGKSYAEANRLMERQVYWLGFNSIMNLNV